MSRRLTGAVLAAALSKAAEAAIAGAVETGAQRLATAVDAGLGLPSPPLWGRAGEGGAAPGGDLPSMVNRNAVAPAKAGAHEHRPPEPGPGLPPAAAVVLDPGLRRDDALIQAGAPATTIATGAQPSTTLTLAAPNLFAREFGALDTPADPVLAPAIDAIRRRPA